MPEWAKLCWPEVPDTINNNPIALLPIGAIEEHGPHMNLGTDWYAIDSLL